MATRKLKISHVAHTVCLLDKTDTDDANNARVVYSEEPADLDNTILVLLTRNI